VKKKYIKVVAEFNEQGKLTPLEIIWDDDRRYEITHVGEMQRAASTVGGAGYKFEITVEGKRRSIWLEDIKFDKAIGGRWFLEVQS